MTRARKTGVGRARYWPIWVATAVMAGLAIGPIPAAEAARDGATQKKASSTSDADRTIATAIAALEAGKADLAVQELTTLISSGKIAQSKLARALYIRGLAYRKQAKPAQAIADFTSALWIKNGLDAQQNADALLNRAGAYRDAGLTDQAEADEKRVAAAAASPNRQATATRTASAPVEAAPAPAAPAETGGGFGGFFNALFGGGTSSPERSSSGSATSTSTSEAGGRQGSPAAPSVSSWSTEASPSTAKSRPAQASPTPNVAGWSDSTVVKKVASTQRPAAPATTGSTGQAATGSYHIQVAAVRSRQEAQAVAARLKQMGAATPGERETAIEEAVMGNMGTLFRVRLGPFASTADVQRLCPGLRDAGLDCLVISR